MGENKINWKSLVDEVAGVPEPDIAYEFSNGRKFESPGANGGVYTTEVEEE